MKLSKYNVIQDIDNHKIIYNTKTSGVLKLNNDYINEFSKINSDMPVQEDLNIALLNGGMIVDDNICEESIIKLKNLVSRYNTSILSLTIAPTMECNFNCIYCYEEGYRKYTMDKNIQDATVNFITNQVKNLNSLNIMWYGGEPLLALDIIESLTDSIFSKIGDGLKYYAGIVTNGYLLSKKVAERLKKLRIQTVQITLDGSPDAHDKRRSLRNGAGTFEKIMDNIECAYDTIPISIRINVDKSNINELDKLLDIIEERNLKNKVSLYLAPVDNINESCFKIDCFTIADFSAEEISFYTKALDRGFTCCSIPYPNNSICGAVSLNSFVIDPKGDIYKCWNNISQENEKVGNIVTGVQYNNKLLSWLLYNPFDEECLDCSVLPTCMGGCPFSRLEKHRKICRSIRYNVLDTLKLFHRTKQLKAKNRA